MNDAGMTSRRRSARSPMRATTGTATRRDGCALNVRVIGGGPGRGVSRLLLDSTVLIVALRGRALGKRLVGLRRLGVEPWVCAISVEETWRSLLPGEEPKARRLVKALRMAPLGA